MPSWIFLMHLTELNFCVIFVNLILIMKLSFTQSCLWEEIHFMIIRSVPGNSITSYLHLTSYVKGNICCITKCTGFIAKWSYSIICIYKTIRQSAPYNCTKWLSDYWAWNGKRSLLMFNIFVVTILIPV